MRTRLPRRANHEHLFGHPAASARGAFRDRHERWLWDAMDAASRQTIVEVAYGEVVWFWRSNAGAKFPERATRALGMTVAKKPVTGKSTKDTVKTVAQGRPDDWLNLW
jgi:predicted Fe-S protein YdhL (DUF1289 family)